MKVFVILLLGVIFVALLTVSVQSIYADHLEPGQGIFKDSVKFEIIKTDNSNYQIYLQTVLRNGDSKMISVSESMHGYVIHHKLTDHIFDTLMGKKEIVTIDNIMYEKVQYIFSPTLEQILVEVYPIFSERTIQFEMKKEYNEKTIIGCCIWEIHYCADFSSIGHNVFQCMPVFQAFTAVELGTSTDIVTHQWTILRVLN